MAVSDMASVGALGVQIFPFLFPKGILCWILCWSWLPDSSPGTGSFCFHLILNSRRFLALTWWQKGFLSYPRLFTLVHQGQTHCLGRGGVLSPLHIQAVLDATPQLYLSTLPLHVRECSRSRQGFLRMLPRFKRQPFSVSWPDASLFMPSSSMRVGVINHHITPHVIFKTFLKN